MPASPPPSPILNPVRPTNMHIEAITPAHYNQILYVCRNMREMDRAEIFCTTDATSAEECTINIIQAARSGRLNGFVASLDCEPIALLGVCHMWQGVVTVWMFATDNFDKIALDLTKFVKRIMIPQFVNGAGVRRAQCFSMIGHVVAHAWLEVLGAKREGIAEGYGKNGEDFTLFAWRFS